MDLNSLKTSLVDNECLFLKSILVTGSVGCGKTTYVLQSIMPIYFEKHNIGIAISYHFEYIVDILENAPWFAKANITIHNNFLPKYFDLEKGKKHLIIVNQSPNLNSHGVNVSPINDIDFVIDNNPFLFIDEIGPIQNDFTSLMDLYPNKIISIGMYSEIYLSRNNESDRKLPAIMKNHIRKVELILCGKLPNDFDSNLRNLEVGEFLKLVS